ncbi:hypothetical protein J7E50_02590 [Pedobacter sp. ISL-68]|uniref:hypothetical protein n=1 Tax=unclassified Pedobacter TaxID=2628915 RepID=UPI001BEBEC71|nr:MULTISPECIES: hypothetical protein [unclassified Pedobacter]MBT2560109.1 hypothetical protein [Pedobacter sp. ISL-64]MBT2589088.1 hypothetical protein [Pedobacter sp. ISL-68]
MKLKELIPLLKNAASDGAQKALSQNGVLSQYLTKAQAYRLYGRSDVDRWISEGLINMATQDGKPIKKCIEYQQLEAVAASSNRITYLPVAERHG